MSVLRFLIIFVLLHGVAYAGWVITEESTDSFGNRLIQTIFIQDNLIRHETPSSIAIIDLNNKTITIVFSQHRVYWSGTALDLKLSTIDVYDRQLEKMLAGLPDYKRKELDSIYFEIKQQMLDSSDYVADREITVVETDEKQEMLGYNAVKYKILVDGVVRETVWHTTGVKPYNDIDINSMMTFMRQLNQGTGRIAQTTEYLNLLKRGMLLKSIEMLPDSNKYETTVTNIREINIVPDFFLPPKNYRKASLPDILNLMPVEID